MNAGSPLPSRALLAEAQQTLVALLAWADRSAEEGRLFSDVARSSREAAASFASPAASSGFVAAGLAGALKSALEGVSTVATHAQDFDERSHAVQIVHAHSSAAIARHTAALADSRAGLSARASAAISAVSASLTTLEGALGPDERACVSTVREALLSAAGEASRVATALRGAPLAELPLAAAHEALSAGSSALIAASHLLPDLASHAAAAAHARARAVLSAAAVATDAARAMLTGHHEPDPSSRPPAILCRAVDALARLAAAVEAPLAALASRIGRLPPLRALSHSHSAATLLGGVLAALSALDRALTGGCCAALALRALQTFKEASRAKGRKSA